MYKPKVESIWVGSINGDYQGVFINGNYHEYSIRWFPDEVLNKLSEYYDFSEVDERDLEVLW